MFTVTSVGFFIDDYDAENVCRTLHNIGIVMGGIRRYQKADFVKWQYALCGSFIIKDLIRINMCHTYIDIYIIIDLIIIPKVWRWNIYCFNLPYFMLILIVTIFKMFLSNPWSDERKKSLYNTGLEEFCSLRPERLNTPLGKIWCSH